MKFMVCTFFLLSFVITLKAQDTSKVNTTEPIADFVEVEPKYPGGPDAMTAFIQANVVYPEKAKERGEQGTVYVQFVVNTDGSICDVFIIKGVCVELDAEAIRLIKLMPKWTPGMQKGKAVRVRYTIPINFIIQDGKSKDDDKKKKKQIFIIGN